MTDSDEKQPEVAAVLDLIKNSPTIIVEYETEYAAIEKIEATDMKPNGILCSRLLKTGLSEKCIKIILKTCERENGSMSLETFCLISYLIGLIQNGSIEIKNDDDTIKAVKYLHAKFEEGAQLPLACFDIMSDVFFQQLGTKDANTAIRFDYNFKTKTWRTSIIFCKMQLDNVIESGSHRDAYRMVDFTKDTKKRFFAIKKYKEAVEPKQYFQDVIMQMENHDMAERFNRDLEKKQITKNRVKFVAASVVKTINETEGESDYYCIEPYMFGDYKKYNSNNGYVSRKNDDLAQAFSHYTYEQTGCRKLFVDIQGVNNTYTDPQIHSRYWWEKYGTGNRTDLGIKEFFVTHKCNAYCMSLGLAYCVPHSNGVSPSTGAVCDSWYTCTMCATPLSCMKACPGEIFSCPTCKSTIHWQK